MPDNPTNRATVTFIGTATALLRIGSFTLLTDPNFLHAGQRAYLGYGLWSKRRTNPALTIDQLPHLDAVILSHLHGDHFDRVARKELAHDLPIFTTPQAERRLLRWGFPAATGLPTWESHEQSRGRETLRITAVPAQHGPGVVNRLLPDVMGSIVDWAEDGVRRLRLYITGDTLCRPLLAQIPLRFPDIDTMLIHLGGTRLLGMLLTMDSRQGTALVRRVQPALTLPIHYDDYPVFRSPLHKFLSRASAQGLPGIRAIRRGETLSLVRPAPPPGPILAEAATASGW